MKTSTSDIGKYASFMPVNEVVIFKVIGVYSDDSYVVTTIESERRGYIVGSENKLNVWHFEKGNSEFLPLYNSPLYLAMQEEEE